MSAFHHKVISKIFVRHLLPFWCRHGDNSVSLNPFSIMDIIPIKEAFL
jgi:hypothetical protein